MTTPVWSASRARMIPYPVPGDCAMQGTSVRPFPRFWPEKSAGDALDYSVDYSAWLADCADSIGKITIDDISEAPATGLSIVWAVFCGGVVSVGLSGGVASMKYKIRIAVTTGLGRTITGIFTLPVSAMPSASVSDALSAPALTFPPGTITINGTPNT